MVITEEKRFEAMNELGDFPMLGESTRTKPWHNSEASRESNLYREGDGSVSSEVQKHPSCNGDPDMEVEPSETVSTNTASHLHIERLILLMLIPKSLGPRSRNQQ